MTEELLEKEREVTTILTCVGYADQEVSYRMAITTSIRTVAAF